MLSSGDVVFSPEGERIVLVDVGQTCLVDTSDVRVWEVALRPGEVQPWHLHHDPYVVLSLEASPGRMDWLDGAEPRLLNEYRGGAVFRPTSPVHRLTNVGEAFYRNRLVEFKDLGENLGGPDTPAVDVGSGDRSVSGQRPGPSEADGRRPVLLNSHTRVWEFSVDPGSAATLRLRALPHVVASMDAPPFERDSSGGVIHHSGGPLELRNPSNDPRPYFVVELSYLAGIEQEEGSSP